MHHGHCGCSACCLFVGSPSFGPSAAASPIFQGGTDDLVLMGVARCTHRCSSGIVGDKQRHTSNENKKQVVIVMSECCCYAKTYVMHLRPVVVELSHLLSSPRNAGVRIFSGFTTKNNNIMDTYKIL